MTKIPVKYETQLDYEFMQPLFEARKVMTDMITKSSQSYSLHNLQMEELRVELDKLDELILRLAGTPQEAEKESE